MKYDCEQRALITAPTLDVVTVDEAKASWRIDTARDDELIGRILKAVASQLDPAAGGWLGRQLAPAIWELQLPYFPCMRIELPYPPLIELTSIKYDDASGVEQTLVANVDYRLVGPERPNGRWKVMPVYGGAWPSARWDIASVRIRFRAGYSNGQAGEQERAAVPEPIKHWILLQGGVLYENREAIVFTGQNVASSPQELPKVVPALLSTFVVYY